MSEARSKLETARFNLAQLVKNSEDPKRLTHYLNDFLSSARSVTWVLKKEFSGKTNFTAWYNAKIQRIDPEKDFALFVKLRNISEKERNVRPNPIIGTTDTIYLKDRYTNRLYDRDGNLINEFTGPSEIREIPKPKKKVERSWFFQERPDDDAIQLCERYYSKLEDIVNECEQKFSS
jgi:hypothetical protein